MSERDRLLPASIAVAGAAIGLGLYFGLRASGLSVSITPAPPSEAQAEVEFVTPSRPEPPRAPTATRPPSPAPASSEDQDLATREVIKALERKRQTLVTQCWAPSAAASAQPPSATFPIRFSFDPDGKLVGFGVADATDARRQDVAECLRKLELGIAVTPPGRIVGMQLDLKLP